MAIRFRGLFEPWETPTGDRRMFKAGGLRNRVLPLPVMMRSTSGGHDGAETVAKITGVEAGPGGRWFSGEFLDHTLVPAVKKAVYLAKEKMLRPSLDLDRSFTVEPRDHLDGKKVAYFTDGNVIGATLVPMPAFDEVTFEIWDDEDGALVASIMAEFATGGSAWDSLPIAPRDYTFDADDAVKRIAAWAGIGTPNADTNKYASMFLWRGGNQTGDTLAQQDFRMPIGDVVNGQPYLVFHAIYAAAALLSGAHGGLPNIPDSDKQNAMGVINQIYPKMAKHFNDPQMHSPFAGGGQQQMSVNVVDFHEEDEPVAAILAAFNAAKKHMTAEPYGDVAYADPGYRDNKKRYPIDTAEHVRAAWSYINQAKNAAEYTEEQLESIKGRIKAAAEKFGVEIADQDFAVDQHVEAGMATFAVGAAPSQSAFADPQLKRATPLTVTADGHVFGHLGKWGECHLGIGDRCVMLPKSRTDYSLFKTGMVILDTGEPLRVGKITVGTGHAHPHYGIVPSRDHYDNSGWCAAVVNVGEDQFGVWVAGVLTDPRKADELRRSPLSGDWRRYNGNLELVAALAVNNPGFPVFHMEESEEFSLVAAGINWRMTGGVTDRDVSVEPPNSFSADVEPEPEDDSQAERAARLAQIKRARRFAQFADMGAPQPMPAPTAQPAAAPAPAAGKAATDINVDPGADPASPDIAELDDPGRDTLLARMANTVYMIEDEETGQEVQPGAFLYKEAQESAAPKAQADAQVAQQAGQQAVQQQQAAQAVAPQPAPAATPPPQG